jgi:hypothetical protein
MPVSKNGCLMNLKKGEVRIVLEDILIKAGFKYQPKK